MRFYFSVFIENGCTHVMHTAYLNAHTTGLVQYEVSWCGLHSPRLMDNGVNIDADAQSPSTIFSETIDLAPRPDIDINSLASE